MPADLTKMSHAEKEAYAAKMKRAFSLVDPSMSGGHWKDVISTTATQDLWDRLCKLHEIAFEDILEAIEFYTATKPVVHKEPTQAAMNGAVRPSNQELLVSVRAAGYRQGPAGDH